MGLGGVAMRCGGCGGQGAEGEEGKAWGGVDLGWRAEPFRLQCAYEVTQIPQVWVRPEFCIFLTSIRVMLDAVGPETHFEWHLSRV